MKTLITILTLTLITACGGDNNTSGKKSNKGIVLPVCGDEINDDDCADIQDTRSNASFARIQTEIRTNNRGGRRGFRTIEILENVVDEKIGSLGVPCRLSVYNGMSLDLKVDGENLVVVTPEGTKVYNRLTRLRNNRDQRTELEINPRKRGFVGRWGKTSQEGRVEVMTTLSIQNESKLTIRKKCSIK